LDKTKVQFEINRVKENNPSLTHKAAKKIARQRVYKSESYQPNKLGSSNVAGLKPRKERRKEENFKPVYNGDVFERVLKEDKENGGFLVDYKKIG